MKNAKIIFGVSAGIAAYKVVELVRLLVKEGVEVRVVMSTNASHFVAPLTFEALSGYPVTTPYLMRKTRWNIFVLPRMLIS